jgi:hypothetical protein
MPHVTAIWLIPWFREEVRRYVCTYIRVPPTLSGCFCAIRGMVSKLIGDKGEKGVANGAGWHHRDMRVPD